MRLVRIFGLRSIRANQCNTKTLSNHHSPFLLHVILFASLTIVIHLRIARFEIRLHQPTNDCKNDGSRLPNSPIEPGSRARQLLDSGRYRGKVKVIYFRESFYEGEWAGTGRGPNWSIGCTSRLNKTAERKKERERTRDTMKVTLP